MNSIASPSIPLRTNPGPHLANLLIDAARHAPARTAVEDENGRSFTYAELAFAADRLATRLARAHIGPGDRVGLFLPKSIESVAAIHGILRAGAAYVPVDATAPVLRGAGILADAGVRAVIVEATLAESLRSAWPAQMPRPTFLIVGAEAPVDPPDAAWSAVLADDSPSPLLPPREDQQTAYILYTSG
jgi:acyl-CoA synthetase (AMP-forming)/AMP-acid ligase II